MNMKISCQKEGAVVVAESLGYISIAREDGACLRGSELTLEEVWKVLENGRWESKRTLSRACGVDEATLGRIINFLDRWDFAEARNAPDLQVRQKPGATSPVEIIRVLRTVANQSKLRGLLAERVACRACGHRNFHFVEENQVECDRCGEKQWYSIQRCYEDTRRLETAQSDWHCSSLLKRLLVRFGLPQEAYVRNIPNPTRYYWFRCLACKETSVDYHHGHSQYLTCQYCRTLNDF